MGPLHNLKVLELAGIGPGPLCAMMLADLGATVLRIGRLHDSNELGGAKKDPLADPLLRGRRAIALDLKDPEAVALVLRLVEKADALIDPFRPGTLERLGLGPRECHARNPRLAYGRMTGWGQTGPMAARAGHDINYIALTGVLDAIGREGQPPTPPLNLVGDNGGGAAFLALGLLSAILEARGSGQGQVVDAAMVDGASVLAMSYFGMVAAGKWHAQRGTNYLDSGAPFYEVYECADGKWFSVGPLEARFYAELLQRLELDPAHLPSREERANWPALRGIFAARFRTRTRDEWAAVFDGSDGCVAPVLSFAEAPHHPHARARQGHVDIGGIMQPAPAPRFSRSQPALPIPPQPGDNSQADLALQGWLVAEEIAALRGHGLLGIVAS